MRRARLHQLGLAVLVIGWLTVSEAAEQNVVALRIAYPGAAPEQIEREVAIPLEQVLEKLRNVKAVLSRCDEGRLTVEVRFAGTARKNELARVAKLVHEFWASTPSRIGIPRLSLEPATLR